MSKSTIDSVNLYKLSYRKEHPWIVNVTKDIVVDGSDETWTAKKELNFETLREVAEWLLEQVKLEEGIK